MIQMAERYGPVAFSCQGDKTALMGLDCFKKVIELQKKHRTDGHVTNTTQMSGTLLDEEGLKFLSRYNFLAGLSLDGSRDGLLIPLIARSSQLIV